MSPKTRYQPGDKIGERYQVHQAPMGGMGEVYLCLDLEEMYPLAIKTFQDKYLADKAARERFTQEALTWTYLEKHRNIVRAYYVESIEGKPYIFMEMVIGSEDLGPDLRSWIVHKRLDLVTTIDFAIQFSLGMMHAREKVRGLVHRDVKPENILVTKDKVVKATDFGLAKTLEADNGQALAEAEDEHVVTKRPSLTRLGTIVGTPPYMSPEQIVPGGKVDVRSDIYAFGCVLYEMLTGGPVFEVKARTERQWMEKWLRYQLYREPAGPRSIVPSIPTDVDALVMRCLRKEEGERYQGFGELLEELVGIYRGLTRKEPVLEVGAVELEAWELSNKGGSLGNLGRFAEALACYDRALAIDPQFARVWVNKGVVLERLGRYDEEIACCDRALAIDPQYKDAWFNKGVALGKLGRYDEALACLDRALAIDPQDAKTWVNKGNALSGLGRPDEALACLDRALAIDPQYGDAWLNKGVALGALGRYDEEIDCCDRALAIDPQDKDAWFNKGVALGKLGRYDKEIDCYDRALAIDPQYGDAWANKGVALGALGRYDEEIDCCDRALAIDPQDTEAWYNKGVALGALGRLDEALPCYDRALAIDPQYRDAWYNKGLALWSLGRYDEAFPCFDLVLAIDPQHAIALYSKGTVLGRLGRYDEALACFDRALTIDPQYKDAWYNKGVALVELGRYDEALPCYDRALAIDPQSAMAWLNKGAVLYNNLRQYREALECFQRAQRFGDPQAAQGIALCMRAMGR
jgi:tetratricopeptide (TPR) repeat protein/tRNA A-37 threonylcarbamoyl transferase component Bud32